MPRGVDGDGEPDLAVSSDAAEIDRLADPSIKAVFVVNPSNPPSVMLAAETLQRIADIVAHDNPDLIVVTDDVYGTFVPGFRSIMDVIPANTIAVYSFSKYFGATGWRLGVIALYCDNVIDRRIAALPADLLDDLDRRYDCISCATADIAFIDRMVADSRQVALNHTAGLSLPQQVQMTLFAAFALVDADQSYKERTRAIVNGRLAMLYQGLGVRLNPDALRAGYYAEIDLMSWAVHRYGADFGDLDGRPVPVSPCRPGRTTGRGGRGRAAARGRVRRPGLVGAGVARQSRRRVLPGHRACGPPDLRGLRDAMAARRR